MSKGNEKAQKIKFIIIYYDALLDLKIDYEEYMILYYLEKISNRNEIGKINKSDIARTFNIQRQKVINIIVKFVKDEILEISNGKYYFHPGHFEKFNRTGKFVIVYLKYWKELKVTLNEYIFLYLTYSLSLTNNNKRAFFNYEFYGKILNRKKSAIYYTLDNLINKKKIERCNKVQIRVKHEIYMEFEKLKTQFSKEKKNPFENDSF